MYFNRAHLLCLCTAVVFSIGIPAIAPGNDIVDFLQKLEEFRRDSREQEVQRRLEQERRIQESRRGNFPQTYDPRAGGYLRDQEIPPGQYTIELPWGNQNVYVRPEPPPEAAKHQYLPNDVRDQSQVVQVVRQLQATLDQMKELADDFELDEWETSAEDAEEALEKLEKGLALGNPEVISKAFEEFEKKWHPLAHQITRAPQTPAPLRRAYQVAAQQDELLHRNLFVAKGPGYNRVQVAALTSQLANYVDKFVKSDTWSNRQIPYQLRRTLRTADRASNDLLESVQTNAPVAIVTSDYQRFDEAWHDIRRQAWQLNGFEPNGDETMRRIAALDRQLHQQLEVQSDRGDSRNRYQSQIRFARSSADQLTAAISSSPTELKDIGRRSRELSLALDNLNNAFEDGGFQGKAFSRAWDQTQNAWKAMQQSVQSIGGPRKNGPFASMYQELQQDMEDLEATVSNTSSGRRHPHHPY